MPHPRLPWAYLAVGAVAALTYLFVPPLKGSALVMNGIGLYGVLGVLGGIRLQRPTVTRPWWCFAAGLLLLLLGDIYTSAYPKLVHASVPFPSAGDALSIAGYPVLMAGLLLLVRARRQRAAGPQLIDSSIMTLSLALIPALLLIAPHLHDRSLGWLPKLVSVAYPIGDIILLGAAIRLAVEVGRRRAAFLLMTAGIVTLLATDFAYGMLTLQGSYRHQRWVELGWIVFHLLWGAAALHPSMRRLSEAETAPLPKLTSLRLGLLTGATLIAPVLQLAHVLPRHDWRAAEITVGSVVVVALVLWRMVGLVRQREKAAARERAMAAAGGLLVAATAPEEIVIATLQVVADLGQGRIDARVCEAGETAAGVVAIDDRGGLSRWEVSGGASAALRGCRAAGITRLPAAVREELRLPEADDPVLALEIRPARSEKPMLLLLVSGRVLREEEAQTATRSLGQQVALALGSAELSEEVHRQAHEARFSTLVTNATDLITVLDADARIVYQSPSIERALGYTPDEVTGQPFAMLLHPDEQDRLLRRLGDGAAAADRAEAIECLLAHRDGGLRHFEILHTQLQGAGDGRIVLNGRDVTERKAFEEQLAHQAFHDPITHLPNRALFHERVRHAVARTVREGTGMAVLFVDLDDFKTVNDSLGHAAGDRVLVEVAQRLSTTIRAADTAARFGGDEFAILLEDVDDLQAAAQTAERILDALARPLTLDGTDLVIRASLGISVAEPGAAPDADELIRNADAATHIAKADGKGDYRVFEPAMHDRVVARLELRADLQRALERNEFELHYQPIVQLADRRVRGVEALLRWRHPVRGLVPPLDFIPLAEETGQIVAIGRWVLREGCRQVQEFREQVTGVAPRVGINLSVKQLFDPDIVSHVAEALEESGLDPSALILEITESVMMTDTAAAVARLQELRGLGCKLALDDFGTGYSSLSYLSQFPLDILKMDRSLLGDGASSESSGLASAVVSIGDTFGLDVVAEGIEHPEQAETLAALACALGQGWHFGRPMPAGQLLEYLRVAAGNLAAGEPAADHRAAAA